MLESAADDRAKPRTSSREVATGKRCNVLDRSIGVLLRLRLGLWLRLRLVLIIVDGVRRRGRPRLSGVGGVLGRSGGEGEREYLLNCRAVLRRLSSIGLRLRLGTGRRYLDPSVEGVRPGDVRLE